MLNTTQIHRLNQSADLFGELVMNQIQQLDTEEWTQLPRTATEEHRALQAEADRVLGSFHHVPLEVELQHGLCDPTTILFPLSRLGARVDTATMHGLMLVRRTEAGVLGQVLRLLPRLALLQPEGELALSLIELVRRYHARIQPADLTGSLAKSGASEAA